MTDIETEPAPIEPVVDPENPDSVNVEELIAARAAKSAKSNRDIDYSCTRCQKDVGRNNLKSKRVQFREMGVSGRIVKTLVTDWLCLDCLAADPDYTAPPFARSPGMRGTRIAES